MDKKTAIIKKLEFFGKNVNKDFNLNKVIFFGSRTTGKSHRYSDIDLLLVSPKFKKLDFVERGAKMYNYWDLNYPVDFLCYTPEEFNKLKKQPTIVKEAVEKGIEIKT
ncbi:MAG: nucleotidyltransferase domain-containing protein [Nanoarchaeota archaeon]|nr:nucleotidyltransferase domain-containing protein [Nanoarchaeota archaeon]MBU1631806.1 nucleotidyltransferase domain-containing protein [Nanoarchaeota archaeon]MBU1876598.1 nucleotidyltransferase domain-containing protein [Nanoarchaeota archaeon]